MSSRTRLILEAWVLVLLCGSAWFVAVAVESDYDAKWADQAATGWVNRDREQPPPDGSGPTVRIEPKLESLLAREQHQAALARRNQSALAAALLAIVAVVVAIRVWFGTRRTENEV
jgi:hypothetical protein